MKTGGGQRRHHLTTLRPQTQHDFQASRKTIAYTRVSSHDQRADLERQKQVLELYCASQGWTFEVVADFGSGMNCRKKGLKHLFDGIVEGEGGGWS